MLARWASKLAAGYRQALQPRLLVLPGLVAGVAAWNAAFPEQQLGLVELGCLVAGFLSYKVRPGGWVALALALSQPLVGGAVGAPRRAQACRPACCVAHASLAVAAVLAPPAPLLLTPSAHLFLLCAPLPLPLHTRSHTLAITYSPEHTTDAY